MTRKLKTIDITFSTMAAILLFQTYSLGIVQFLNANFSVCPSKQVQILCVETLLEKKGKKTTRKIHKNTRYAKVKAL